VSTRLLTATAQSFFHAEQADLTKPYVARYFDEMPAMASRRDALSVLVVARSAYPHHAVSAETLAAAERMLARDDLEPNLRRVAVDSTDDLRRALAARALSR
jgi:aminopeptidase N